MTWYFNLRFTVDTGLKGKWLQRSYTAIRIPGGAANLIQDGRDFTGESGGGSQKGLKRTDLPREKRIDEFERFKPADCRVAYGPGDLKTLPADIKGLVLSGEGILQRDFDLIARFRDLTYLELEDWKEGRRVRLDALKELKNLEAVELHNLFKADVPSLLELKHLKALYIRDGGRLTEENLIQLAGLPSLVVWKLPRCPLTLPVMKVLVERKQLRALESGNLSPEVFRELGKLEELRDLDLFPTSGLAPRDFESLAGLKHLTDLQLGSGINDDVMKIIGRLPALRVLWIYNAHDVNDGGMMNLRSLSELRYLNVESKQLTKPGMRALGDKLPGTWEHD